MSMFTLAISCVIISNLPWFMDLTFQVPMQYCSLQHRTLLLSPVTSTTGCCCCFGSIPSFFLELFLHCSPVAYWAPTDLGSFSFSILSFCLFILFMGFSRQEYWSGLTFPSPVDHILSDLSTRTCLGLPHMAWLNFTKLDKLWSVWWDLLVVCDCGFSLSALWCPLSAPTILIWVSLTLDVGYLIPYAAWPEKPQNNEFNENKVLEAQISQKHILRNLLISWLYLWKVHIKSFLF